MTVGELLTRMDSREISGWLAYDRTNNKEWVDNYNKEVEIANFDYEAQARQFKALLKGTKT